MAESTHQDKGVSHALPQRARRRHLPDWMFLVLFIVVTLGLISLLFLETPVTIRPTPVSPEPPPLPGFFPGPPYLQPRWEGSLPVGSPAP